MKSLLVEPYTPYFKSGKLLSKNTSFNWPLACSLLLLLAGIIVPFASGMAFTLGFLVFGVFVLTSVVAESESNYFFKRKRVDVMQHYTWYDKEVMKEHSLYHDKVIEYLDYLRSGGDSSFEVQCALEKWRQEAEKEIEMRKANRVKQVAEMFNFENQLEEYRTWKERNVNLY